MNVTDYTYLINKPDVITEKQTEALGNVLIEFPYFQSARALRLKGLHNQNSFKYNYALKVTAAHTADRSVLFDFITSETFTSIQNDFYDKKLRDLLNITVLDSEVVAPEKIEKSIEVRIDPIEQSILTSIKQATSNTSVEPAKTEEIAIQPIIDEISQNEETRAVVDQEVIKEEAKPEEIIILEKTSKTSAEETQSADFEEEKNENESIDIIKEEVLVVPVKENRPTFFEEVVVEDEIFDPIIEKNAILLKEETTPDVFEEPKKFNEIRIDPIEESIYNSIKEATTVVFEASKPVEKEPTAIADELKTTEEQPKEIAALVFEEVKITDQESNEVTPVVLYHPETIEENSKEVISFILEEPVFLKAETEDTVVSEEEVIENETIDFTTAFIQEPKTVEEKPEETPSQETVKIAEENLEIGKPLDFSVNEKHSFQEWLQLARPEPIDRSNEFSQKDAKSEEEIVKEVETTPEIILPPVKKVVVEDAKKKKAQIIDKFIEANPKIPPIKPTPITLPPVQFDINQDDNSYLMTETLARVYLEQKKYTKAIQAYEILILKYPEKISFFADRISDIKILQQNNNNN